MTSPTESDIPEAARGDWDDLLVKAKRRGEVKAEYDDVTEQCEALVIRLLRAGVKRSLLVDRPFSDTWISRVQRREGIRTRRRRPA